MQPTEDQGHSLPRQQLIRDRIQSGFYDRPAVIDRVVDGLARDLTFHSSNAQTRSAEHPTGRGTRSNRDPWAHDADAGVSGRDAAGVHESGLLAGGQGRTADDVHGSMMVIVYVGAACLAWLVVALVLIAIRIFGD